MSDWREELLTRLQPLKLSPEQEAGIAEELGQHLDDRARELVAGGMTADEARRAALADLDAPGELARRLHEVLDRPPLRLPPPGAPARGRWLRAAWHDVRYAIRTLRRAPGFALAAVGTLALTIGPTTAILSVGNWLLWRPVPGVAEPDRLGVVWFGEWHQDRNGVSPRFVSHLNIDDLLRASDTIDAMAGWQEQTVSLAIDDALQHVGSAHVTANFLDLLGLRPAAGRGFTRDEDRPPYGSPVAVISDGLARRAFGGPDAAVGRRILLNGRPLSIVGVMPPGFAGTSPFSRVDVWYPSLAYTYVHHFTDAWVQSSSGRAGGLLYTFVARLAPDAGFEAMQAELDVLVPALAERYPDDNAAFATVRARVFPGLGPMALQRAQYRRVVHNLLWVGGVLLLLGCANVANLLISRGVRRQRERTVRAALGASRWRLARLQVTESCVLAVAGAVLGAGLAVWLKGLIQTLLLSGAEGGAASVVPMDLRVLGATLTISIACGLVAGLAPAWMDSTRDAAGQLGRGDARTSTRGSRVRSGLAGAQLALSLALVANALLLVATLRNLGNVDLGFDPRGVTAHALELASHGYSAERSLVYTRDLLARTSTDPRLRSVSLSRHHPFGNGYVGRVVDPGNPDTTISVDMGFVSPGYFRTLDLPLIAGRTFTADETFAAAADGSPVVVGERLARRLFGDASPLGRRVSVPTLVRNPPQDLVIVGVARESRRRSLTGDPDLQMFVPFGWGGAYAAISPVLLVRSSEGLGVVGERVQAHGSALDPTLPFQPPRPLTAAIARELVDQRTFAWVLSLLGGLGFALAGVGLGGLLAQLVGERTREFGIRMAIGAKPAHVFGLVFRQAGWIALAGGTAGLGLAILASRVLEAQLFGVSRLAPWVYVSAALSLALVVFVAGLWPACRATRIQPVEALRTE